MAEAYRVELRERVVEAYEAGEGTFAEVAERFALGLATVKRWVWLKRKSGHVLPKPKAGGTPSEITREHIEALLAESGDATASELTVAFNRTRSRKTRVHMSSMKRALRRHGYVVKKSADGRWRVCGPTSSQSARRT